MFLNKPSSFGNKLTYQNRLFGSKLEGQVDYLAPETQMVSDGLRTFNEQEQRVEHCKARESFHHEPVLDEQGQPKMKVATKFLNYDHGGELLTGITLSGVVGAVVGGGVGALVGWATGDAWRGCKLGAAATAGLLSAASAVETLSDRVKVSWEKRELPLKPGASEKVVYWEPVAQEYNLFTGKPTGH